VTTRLDPNYDKEIALPRMFIRQKKIFFRKRFKKLILVIVEVDFKNPRVPPKMFKHAIFFLGRQENRLHRDRGKVRDNCL
jgi:hypothetical protein